VVEVESAGEGDGAVAMREVVEVALFNLFELGLEGWDEGVGQDGQVVFVAFAGADDEAMGREVNIFNPQADTFHQAQAAAVEQLRHKAVDAVEVVEESEDFGAG